MKETLDRLTPARNQQLNPIRKLPSPPPSKSSPETTTLIRVSKLEEFTEEVLPAVPVLVPTPRRQCSPSSSCHDRSILYSKNDSSSVIDGRTLVQGAKRHMNENDSTKSADAATSIRSNKRRKNHSGATCTTVSHSSTQHNIGNAANSLLSLSPQNSAGDEEVKELSNKQIRVSCSSAAPTDLPPVTNNGLSTSKLNGCLNLDPTNSIQYMNLAAVSTERGRNLTTHQPRSTDVNFSVESQIYHHQIQDISLPHFSTPIGIPAMYPAPPSCTLFANTVIHPTVIHPSNHLPPEYCSQTKSVYALHCQQEESCKRQKKNGYCSECKNFFKNNGFGLQTIAERMVQRRMKREKREKDDILDAKRRTREYGYKEISETHINDMVMHGSLYGLQYPFPTKLSALERLEEKESDRLYKKCFFRVFGYASKKDRELQSKSLIERILSLEATEDFNKFPSHKMKKFCNCCKTLTNDGSFRVALGKMYLSKYCFDPVASCPENGYLPLDEKQKEAIATNGACGVGLFPIPTKMKLAEVSIKDSYPAKQLKESSNNSQSPAIPSSSTNSTDPDISHQSLVQTNYYVNPSVGGKHPCNYPLYQIQHNPPLVYIDNISPFQNKSAPLSTPIVENIPPEVPNLDGCSTAEANSSDESLIGSDGAESLDLEVEEGEIFSVKEKEILEKLMRRE